MLFCKVVGVLLVFACGSYGASLRASSASLALAKRETYAKPAKPSANMIVDYVYASNKKSPTKYEDASLEDLMDIADEKNHEIAELVKQVEALLKKNKKKVEEEKYSDENKSKETGSELEVNSYRELDVENETTTQDDTMRAGLRQEPEIIVTTVRPKELGVIGHVLIAPEPNLEHSQEAEGHGDNSEGHHETTTIADTASTTEQARADVDPSTTTEATSTVKFALRSKDGEEATTVAANESTTEGQAEHGKSSDDETVVSRKRRSEPEVTTHVDNSTDVEDSTVDFNTEISTTETTTENSINTE